MMTAEQAHPSHESIVQDAVFDLAGDGFVIVGEGGEVLRINASAERMFKYRNDEIAGQPVDRLFVGFTPQLLEPIEHAPRNGGGPPSIRRVQGRRQDSTTIPLELTARRAQTPAGSLTVLRTRAPRLVPPSPDERAASAARIGSFGYWSLDLIRQEVSVSDEILEMLGVGAEAISTVPRGLDDILHPEDRREFARALDEALVTGDRLDTRHRVLVAEESIRIARSVGELRFDPDGTPVEMLGITFDVTDHERVSEALRESENTLNAIVNSTTAMIYIKDTEGKYLLINRHFEEVFGVDNREQRGKTDYEYLPREVADAVRANDKLVLEAGRPVEFEELVPHQGEDHIYISIKFPLRHLSGEIYAVCGISTDITERKRAEAELESTKQSLERLVDERTANLRDTNRRLQEEIAEREETAAQLQRLFDTAREGIWLVDEAGRTTFANPRMGEILGYEPREMHGRPIFDFMTEERRQDAANNLERRRQGISEDHDFELQRKDGSKVWTLISTGPVHDKDGNIVGALAMVTDITERKRAEEYQALLLQELDHRVKNTLATVAALSDLTMAGAGSLAEFAQAFEGRIQAMARTHEALARGKWKGVSFEELATLVLAAFRTGDRSRISISGDPGHIPPNAITPFALTLNELGTNALKHGALSDGHGAVELAWEMTSEGRLSVLWRENGGPSVTAPASGGMGLKLMRGLIEYELNGSLQLDFAPEGLVCRVNIPISKAA